MDFALSKLPHFHSVYLQALCKPMSITLTIILIFLMYSPGRSVTYDYQISM